MNSKIYHMISRDGEIEFVYITDDLDRALNAAEKADAEIVARYIMEKDAGPWSFSVLLPEDRELSV